MKQLELLLPFSIPPAPLARDLIKQVEAPALTALLGRAHRHKTQRFEDFARLLPHEAWLACSNGGANQTEIIMRSVLDSSPPDTHDKMKALGLECASGHWFTLSPAHIHIARDHLVLTDSRKLEITEQEASDLFAVAQASCAELGRTLVYGNSTTWFLQADDWADMQTSTPDAACGHNIDIWMPKGSQDRAWRKLQNEIQMLWFDHAVNSAREMRGMKPINSVWLWGGSSQSANHVAYLSGAGTLNTILADDKQENLLLIDDLIEPSLSNDWGDWLQRLQQLDAVCFSPLLQALRSGRLDKLSLILSDADTLAQFTVTPWSLRRFWIRPTLNHLQIASAT